MNAWINNLPGPRLAQVVETQGDALKSTYMTDDVYFAVWMHAVNQAIIRRIGLGFMDLEDWLYRDAYDADMAPREAALQMLADSDFAALL